MRFVALLTGLLVVLSNTAHAAGFRTHGVSLPNGAVEIGEGRFRLPEGLEASLKWYKTVYKPEKYPRKLIVDQPGIKAYHLTNPDPDGEWEGFNLYVYQGETRLFVLSRDKK